MDLDQRGGMLARTVLAKIWQFLILLANLASSNCLSNKMFRRLMEGNRTL